MPGQYYDAETGTHYNYFRDYDPAIGRYRQSDPVGLLAGLSTYSYVSGRPLSLLDPFGLAEICKKIEEAVHRQRGRDWKVTSYEPLNDQYNTFKGLFEWLAHRGHGGMGIFGQTYIPILEDIILYEIVMARFEVCYDDCTGAETYRRKLGEQATGQFWESVVTTSGRREGNPTFSVGPPLTTRRTRWGV